MVPVCKLRSQPEHLASGLAMMSRGGTEYTQTAKPTSRQVNSLFSSHGFLSLAQVGARSEPCPP